MSANIIKNIEKWGKDRPVLISIIAQQAAVGAESITNFLDKVKNGDLFLGNLEAPSKDDWLALYLSNKRVSKFLINAFKELSELSEIGSEFFNVFQSARKERRIIGSNRFNTKIKREIECFSQDDWDNIFEFWENLYELNLDDIHSEIANIPDDKLAEKMIDLLVNPEFLFFFKVFIPCWLIYGEYPGFLLRKARTGDKGALDKLLRLDGTCIHDSKISAMMLSAQFKGQKSTYDRIMTSVQKYPKAKISVQKIKMNLSGFISACSTALGQKLTEPEIRKLFGAVARDTGKGEIDTDIPESPEAFAKAIQRERHFWSYLIPQPDKK